jgi:diguanylate cyclase (GGDEF)-like protein
MLTVPFILQVVTVVGLVGYLSYLNGQRSVEDLTNQLMDAVSKRVEQKLTSYLATPRLVARINSDALRRGDLDLNLGRSNPKTEQFLWQQMQLFNNLTWISLGTEAGDSMGVWRPGEGQNLQISISNRSTDYYGTYYATDGQGKRTVKLKVEKPAFDPRTRPWYKSAIAARQVIWTDIYPGFTPGTIFIASSQPLYDRTGKLMGVCGVDISLLEIQRFLADNPVSPSGQVFIIERSGLLVASSSQERPFRLASGQSPKRVNVLESQTPLIRSTAVSLDRQLGDFVNLQQPQKFYFNSDGQPRFVRVLPFSQKPGLDWVIAIVVPEADVMGQIHRNTQTTIWICLAALAAIIALNTAIGRWLAKPIRELSYASQQIAGGQFVDRVRLPRIRELFTLADSFNQMSQEIQQSRQQLEEYSRSLEQKVSDRTQALQEEIQRRSEVEAALQAANAKFQHLAYVDGLTQISNRRLFDERLLHEWSRMKREQLPLSLILCDVDYFKQYNDTYGHQVGDECLQDVAKAIALATRRPADLAARYGGEEFIALLPNTDLTGAIEVARAIQTHIKHLQRPHERSQVSQYVTASMGIASTIPTKATTPEQLLLEVDRALYQAKREGRDRIAIGLFSD